MLTNNPEAPMTEEKPNESGPVNQVARLLNVARGCHDYGGGYRDKAESEIFHHGIQTVINSLEAAARNDPNDMQVNVLEKIGKLTPEPAGLDGISSKTFRIEHNPNCVKPFLVRFPGKGKGMIHGDQRDAIGCGMTIIEAINAAEDPYRKIEIVTPEPVTNEAAREESKIAAVTEKLERYKRILIEKQDFCGAASVKDCLQLLNGFEPKLLKLADDEKATLQQTIAKQSDEIEELKVERDQLHKTRESLEIKQLKLHQWHCSVVKLAKELGWNDASEQPVSEWLRAKISPPEPAVIEGRGQVELSRFAGYVITCKKENTDDWMQGLATRVSDLCKEIGDPDRFGYDGERIVKADPPRAFVAPEKPEQHLVAESLRTLGVEVDRRYPGRGPVWVKFELNSDYARRSNDGDVRAVIIQGTDSIEVDLTTLSQARSLLAGLGVEMEGKEG